MRSRRWRALAAAVAAAMLAYPLAALFCGFVPRNAGFVARSGGTAIFVCSNGIHADLLLPVRGVSVDWAVFLPPGVMRAHIGYGDYLGFGWGDRDFYLATPRWSDFDLRTALHALIGGGPTVVHIDLRAPPAGDPNCLSVAVDAKAMQALETYIEAAMARDAGGRPMPLPGAGYGVDDGFVIGTGHYSPILTCNDWARRALDAAGIRTPLWSPFPGPLLLQIQLARHGR